VLLALLLLPAACSGRITPPPLDADEAGRLALQEYDLNNDAHALAAVDALIDVIVWVCVAVILGKWALEGLLDLLTAFWPFDRPFRRTLVGENCASEKRSAQFRILSAFLLRGMQKTRIFPRLYATARTPLQTGHVSRKMLWSNGFDEF
jgi:hypothetical protein